MFDIGSFELLLLLVLSLIILGPEQLKSVAKYVGKTISKIRSFSDDVKKDIDEGMGEDLKESINEIRGEIDDASVGFKDDFVDEDESAFVKDYLKKHKK